MSDIVFANKYRPKKLADVIGQDVVTTILTNSFKQKKLHHAYLLEGFYGSGKTSVSRIMAAMSNCEKGPTLEPCGECQNCQEIFSGKSMDVKEIDAASNRGIDDIRNIKKDIAYYPMSCKTKYVIIDECMAGRSRVDTYVGQIPIGLIVNNKLTVKVKSFNHNTGKVEYKPISKRFKNSGKKCFKVQSEGSGAVFCSEGHLFSTPLGYKPLEK